MLDQKNSNGDALTNCAAHDSMDLLVNHVIAVDVVLACLENVQLMFSKQINTKAWARFVSRDK